MDPSLQKDSRCEKADNASITNHAAQRMGNSFRLVAIRCNHMASTLRKGKVRHRRHRRTRRRLPDRRDDRNGKPLRRTPNRTHQLRARLTAARSGTWTRSTTCKHIFSKKKTSASRQMPTTASTTWTTTTTDLTSRTKSKQHNRCHRRHSHRFTKHDRKDAAVSSTARRPTSLAIKMLALSKGLTIFDQQKSPRGLPPRPRIHTYQRQPTASRVRE